MRLLAYFCAEKTKQRTSGLGMKKALKYIGVWLLIMIGVSILAAIPALVLIIVMDSSLIFDHETSEIWLLAIGNLITNLAVLYVFRKRRYANFSFLWSDQAKRLYFWIFIAGVGYLLADFQLEEYLPSIDMDRETLEDLSKMVKNPFGFICGSFLAPLAEEVVFRGAVERALLKKNWNPWLAIVVSAALFGFLHLNVTQGVSAFISGIFMGWLFYRTRSIWPGVMIHVMNNTLASLWEFVPEDVIPSVQISPWIYTLTLVPLGLIILVFALKKINRMADGVDLSMPFLDEDDWKALQQPPTIQGYHYGNAPVVTGTPLEPMEKAPNDEFPVE